MGGGRADTYLVKHIRVWSTRAVGDDYNFLNTFYFVLNPTPGPTQITSQGEGRCDATVLGKFQSIIYLTFRMKIEKMGN